MNKFCLLVLLLHPAFLSFPASAQLMSAGVYVPCGDLPADVIAVELDGQPGIDLVTASNAAGSVSILLNQGQGTFASPTIVMVDPSTNFFTLCAADLDGDLDNDLVIGRGATISVLVNDGFAGFTPGQTLSTNGQFVKREICAADIDGDDDVDVLWGNRLLGGGLWLALNEGEIFAEPVELFHSKVNDPIVAHLDLDSYLDVAFHRGSSTEVIVLMGLGDGTFQEPVTLSVPEYWEICDLATGDLDDDTDWDLLILSAGPSAYVHQFENLGDGTFGEPTEIAQAGSFYGLELIVPDLDGSGCGDVVPVCEEPWHEVFFNDCEGGFSSQILEPYVRACAVAAADLDGDTDLDLVYAVSEADSLIVHRNTRLEVVAAGDPPVVASLGPRIESLCPNPFNPSTTVSFAIDQPQSVEISIYDLSGKHIAVLADCWFQEGTHSLDWEGRDLQGNAVASGTYLLRMVSDEGVAVEKMMLIR